MRHEPVLVGVTKRHFESLSKDSTSFVCQWCSLSTSKAVVAQVQSMTTSSLSELAATKEALAKQIPSFQVLHNDRNRQGGGVLIYVSNVFCISYVSPSPSS